MPIARIVNKQQSVDFTEHGSTGQMTYSIPGMFEDYNPEIDGRNWIKVANRMRRDGQVKGVGRAYRTPIVAADWRVEPGNEDPASVRNAEFIHWNLFKRLDRPFSIWLEEALNFVDYGYYLFEKVFDIDTWPQPRQVTRTQQGRGRPKNLQPVVVWKDFAPRHPRTVYEWEFDQGGRAKEFQHERYAQDGSYELVNIDLAKCLHFVFDQEGGNPIGNPALKSAYKHWYIKEQLYKIDAIQKERHSIGIPMIGVPPGATESDKKEARELGKNLRANEKAFILKMPGWDIDFAELHAQLPNIMSSIEHHDVQIARSMLAQFINLGTGSGSTGSTGLSEISVSLFMESLRNVGRCIETVLNKAVEELIDYNFSDGSYPEIKMGTVGHEVASRSLSVTLRNMIESQGIRPDDQLEMWIREQIGAPKRDEATERTAADQLSKEVTATNKANRVEIPTDA